ncbi:MULTISPECIES: fimbrial protein [Gibbsiella]|uniref:Fimbrial-type adhesion domain-containing protein n=1 Tax=Gibbsiella dentisursi TaxID=796890 RepID=A0ABP7M046_9GAMM|nr:fimbrial protein [Gibbsiella quercinecans]
MKDKIFTRALLAVAMGGLALSGTAMATTSSSVGGGTITFSGSVTDTTCNVTTNNGSDFTVSLEPITTDALGTSTGILTSGATAFTIAVSGCSGYTATSTTAQALDITFSGANISDDETYLKNATGTATGVGIALTSDGSKAITLDTALDTGLATTSSSSSTDSAVYDTGAAGDITYYANYYNYGGSSVTTGSVVTTATYVFSYE